MNKKAIAILGAIFVLIVGTLGFLIYLKYAGSSKKSPAPTAQTSATGSPASLIPAATTTPPAVPPVSAINQLSSDQVVSPALFFNGSGITYFDNQGNLYQATLQNTGGQLALTGKKQLDIPQKPNITKIFWPQNSNDFIAQTTDAAGKTSWSYFNSSSGAYSDFPLQVQAFDWMPSGKQIAYVFINNGKAALETGDPSFKTWQKIGDLYQNDNIINVSPDGSQLLFYESLPPTSSQNPINSVSIDGKVWKSLVKNGYNFGALWSPDGQKLLFGKKDPVSLQYQLWYYNLASGEVKNLGLFTTPDKSVWGSDSNTIYAAVPLSPASGAGSLTNDSFFKLNTSTLDKQQYSASASPVDGEDLFLSSTGNDLFFKNAQDGGLYYLDLTQ